MSRLCTFILALWWGSLVSIGLIVVPMLFTNLPTPALAGGMAAKLFGAQTWIALLSGLGLLTLMRSEDNALLWLKESALPYVVSAMFCAALSEFVISPRIVSRDNLALWHSLGTGLYALQFLAVSLVLWRLSARLQK